MKVNSIQKENIRCPYLSNLFIKIFDDYCERLKSPRSKLEYKYVVFSLCNHARCDFLQLTGERIKEFLIGISKNNEISSASYELKVIRAISRFLDEKADVYLLEPRYLSLFSNIDAKIPDLQFTSEALPDLSEIDRVLQYFKQNNDIISFMASSLVLRTALTTSELVSLEKGMFIQDLNGNYGMRFKVSSFASRFVKIPDDVAILINKSVEQRTDSNPALFLNRRGSKISIRSLQYRLHEACLASEIKPFTYNDLRTVSQVIMLKNGAPLGKVAEYVDVKKTDWFYKYNRVVKEFQDSAVDYTHIKVKW